MEAHDTNFLDLLKFGQYYDFQAALSKGSVVSC